MTVSKDVLYDSPLAFKRAFKHLARARDDSQKYLALKELLKSRGADHILQSKRYHDRSSKKTTSVDANNKVTQSFDF